MNEQRHTKHTLMTDLFLSVLDHVVDVHTLRGILFLRYMGEWYMRVWTDISGNGVVCNQNVQHASVHALNGLVERGMKSTQLGDEW